MPKVVKFSALLDKTLRLISARPRSEKEILDYLQRKKIDQNLVTEIIQKLKSLRMLDDSAFAEWWIEQRATFRPKGKIALKVELKQKGIGKEIIDELIGNRVDEFALAKQAAQKKIKLYRKLSPQEFRQKMTSFLAQRGFTWETIKKVLEEKS